MSGVAESGAGATAASAIVASAMSADESNVVVQDSFLSEIVLKLADKMELMQRKVRDAKVKIETEKALRRDTNNASQGDCAGDVTSSFPFDPSDSTMAGYAQYDAKLEKLGEELVQTLLQFDGLEEAIRAEQVASAINRALERDETSALQLDDEEVNYVKGLLSDQTEIAKEVANLENDRVQASLDQMEAMVELEREMSFIGELYPSVAAAADADEDEKENDGGNKKMTAREAALAKTLAGKKNILTEEERKLDQMRIMLQKLILAVDPDKLGDEMRGRCFVMAMKCGQTAKQWQETPATASQSQ